MPKKLKITRKVVADKKSKKSKSEGVIAYCVKCREKREMSNATEQVTANNKRGMKGQCSVCGTGMYRILGNA